MVMYQVVTNEISAVQADGSKQEVYRFDPGVYVVNQGDTVELAIRGLKGHDHPIVIEGYGIRANVARNQVTHIKFQATRPGSYRVICLAHTDERHHGPMEGYLIVLPEKQPSHP